MPVDILYLLLLLSVTIASGLLTFYVRKIALAQSIIDIPNERSSHTQPTPRGGGLAIVIVTVLAWICLGLGYFHFRWLEVLGYALPTLFIAGISWIDDLRSLPNKIRFLSHLLAAGCAIFVFGYFQNIGLIDGWELHLGRWGIPLTLFWIVGLTNVYNFMDGIDGIAGTQSIIAGISWSLIGFTYNQPMIVLLALGLTASSMGFLYHNWPPARIFMGDVGSAFLGYSFAVVPLMLGRETPVNLLLLAVFPLWLFIADATFTILRRAQRRENIFTAHRSHLYQRLVLAGYPHRTVTLWYTFLSMVGAGAACLLVYSPANWGKTMILITILFFAFVLLHQVVLSAERAKKYRSSSQERDLYNIKVNP